jgi:hypothetical protein
MTGAPNAVRLIPHVESCMAMLEAIASQCLIGGRSDIAHIHVRAQKDF